MTRVRKFCCHFAVALHFNTNSRVGLECVVLTRCTALHPCHAEAADVWSLGVCLYCFLYGRLPFMGSCLLDVSNAIRNDEVCMRMVKLWCRKVATCE